MTRYTYISTQDSLTAKSRIGLFKDVLGASGDTTSTSVSYVHRTASPILYLSTVTTNFSSEDGGQKVEDQTLVAVTQQGAVLGFNPETLEPRWDVGSAALLRGLPSSPAGSDCTVQFAQFGLAADVIDGMFGGKDDIFANLAQEVSRDGYNPEVLLVVLSVSGPALEAPQRYLQVLAITPSNAAKSSVRQGVLPVFSSPIPSPAEMAEAPSQYRLDIRSGSLQALQGGTIYAYTLLGGTIRVENSFDIPGVTSFLRLSRSSILASTLTTLDIYNPLYRSLQATTSAEPSSQTQEQSIPYRKTDPCTFISYFATREIAVAVRGSALIAVQVEPPAARTSKRRAEGLLIDSIGRGLPRLRNTAQHPEEETTPSVFGHHLPGSTSDGYWADWEAQIAEADALLESKGMDAFEIYMAAKFGIELAQPDGSNGDQLAFGEWIYPNVRADYPRVDRRWVLYAISKVFSWRVGDDGQSEEPCLECKVTEGNLLSYLVDAGHLTTSNLRSAFKDHTFAIDRAEMFLANALPQLISDIDPTTELLVSYLSATKVGAVELVASIRLIMRSLELVQASTKNQLALASDEKDPDEAELIGMELDKAEEELRMIEFYSNDADTRARGLGVAFSKLGACATPATVKSIRRLLKPEEILSLINILRMELIQDGWTTRYLDAIQSDFGEMGEAPPDGSITLIADLLCRCIDAIGSAGWLNNSGLFASMATHSDTSDFIQQLKAEVSVALEGIEEAVRLRGILTEVVKYGAALQRAQKPKAVASAKPSAPPPSLEQFSTETRMLPLGLKAVTPRILGEKIVSGGEIIQRSKRETAMLIRRNLGPYVIERVGPRN